MVSIDNVAMDFTCLGNAYPPRGWILDTNQPDYQVTLYACNPNSMWKDVHVDFPSNATPGTLDCTQPGNAVVYAEDAQNNEWTGTYGDQCSVSITEVPTTMTSHAAGSVMNANIYPATAATGQHVLSVVFDVPHS
jgi:hypothetical protein